MKGASFEREICKSLSLWWSEGNSDAIFWRTHGSGGRATTRAKKGDKTPNSHGDVMALDSLGEDFLKVFAIEIKRGYSTSTPFDVFDKPESAAMQAWEKWVQQAYLSQTNAQSLTWLIIAKRDKRIPFVVMTASSWEWLFQVKPTTFFMTKVLINCKGVKLFQIVAGVPLEDFYALISPAKIKERCQELVNHDSHKLS